MSLKREKIQEKLENVQLQAYINFYIGNHCVLVPQFGDEHDSVAVEILKECFPERDIIPVEARVILTGGGIIHCITQQIPAKQEVFYEKGQSCCITVFMQ